MEVGGSGYERMEMVMKVLQHLTDTWIGVPGQPPESQGEGCPLLSSCQSHRNEFK